MYAKVGSIKFIVLNIFLYFINLTLIKISLYLVDGVWLRPGVPRMAGGNLSPVFRNHKIVNRLRTRLLIVPDGETKQNVLTFKSWVSPERSIEIQFPVESSSRVSPSQCKISFTYLSITAHMLLLLLSDGLFV